MELNNTGNFSGVNTCNKNFYSNNYFNNENIVKENKINNYNANISNTYKPLRYPAYRIGDLKQQSDSFNSSSTPLQDLPEAIKFKNQSIINTTSQLRSSFLKEDVFPNSEYNTINRNFNYSKKEFFNSQKNNLNQNFHNKKFNKLRSQRNYVNHSLNMVQSNNDSENTKSNSNQTSNFNNKRKPSNFISVLNIANLNEEDKFNLHMTILALYKDRVKPNLNEIWLRLSEYKNSLMSQDQFIYFYSLNDSLYQIKMDNTNTIVVYLKNAPSWFKGWVDTKNPNNCFTASIWKQLIFHFNQGLNKSISHQIIESKINARYNLAKALRECEKFKKRSLGELYHLVELSLLHGILVYHGNSLIPSISSEWIVHSTFNLDSITNYNDTSSNIILIDRLDELFEIIIDLLKSQYPRYIYLSKIKNKIYQKYEKIVNPRFFNYLSLEDLILDQFKDEILVRRQNNLVTLRFHPKFIYGSFIGNECILQDEPVSNQEVIALDQFEDDKTDYSDLEYLPPLINMFQSINQAPKSIILEHWKALTRQKNLYSKPIDSLLLDKKYSLQTIINSLDIKNSSLNEDLMNFFLKSDSNNLSSRSLNLSADSNYNDLKEDKDKKFSSSINHFLNFISFQDEDISLLNSLTPLPDVTALTSNFLDNSSSEFKDLLNYYSNKIDNHKNTEEFGFPFRTGNNLSYSNLPVFFNQVENSNVETNYYDPLKTQVPYPLTLGSALTSS